MMAVSKVRWIVAAGLGLLYSLPAWCDWLSLGPFGGSALVVAADPNSSKTFLAGTANALLFRSQDAGESWTALPFPAQMRGVLHTLAIDPQRAGVYFAGLSSERQQYSGLLRSTDAGATWQQAPDLRYRQVRAIAFWKGNSQIVAAGTEIGIYQSRDGGITWRRISPLDNVQLQPVVALAFDPKNSGIIYAGTPHLPWKTTDGGETWRSIHAGMLDDSDVFSIQVDRNRPQRVFASACSGIYRSLNGGASWTRLMRAKDAADRTYVIVQDPQYENVWFAGTTFGMIRSADGGSTWEKLGSFATRSITFDLGWLGRILIATDEAGILRSGDDGKEWQQVNHGFCNRRLTALSTASGGVLYTRTVDNATAFRLAREAEEWEEVLPEFQAIVPGFGSRPTVFLSPPWSPSLVIGSSEVGLSLSEDGGANWERVYVPAMDPNIRGLVALDPPWIAAVSANGVFLTTDGRRWKLSIPQAGKGEVHDVAATGDQNLFAATNSGLRASADAGASWQPVRGELDGDTIQALCHHPIKTSVLFAAKYGLIYTSSDTGRSWTKISPNDWPVTSIKQLAMVPELPGQLFVLTPQQGTFVLFLDRPVRPPQQ